MGRTVLPLLTFLLLLLLLLLLLPLFASSGDSVKRAVRDDLLKTTSAISTTEDDITTPLATIPNTNFPTTSASPILNPATIPENPATMVPFNTPTVSSPVNPGASWCIASQTAASTALQIALDYACGNGRADCSAVQPGGNCYYPNTVHDHASYAFNNYYQKNPVPNSCNFGGAAVVTSANPSSGTCQYPSTSTSSSVLDTSNQNQSTIFGTVPSGPPASAAAPAKYAQPIWSAACLFVLVLLKTTRY